MTEIFSFNVNECTAPRFFNAMLLHRVDLVVDTRSEPTNPLSEFTRGEDLKYLVEAVTLGKYVYDPLFAPTSELQEGYGNGRLSWLQYVKAYRDLMVQRRALETFQQKYAPGRRSICLVGNSPAGLRSYAEGLCGMLETDQE